MAKQISWSPLAKEELKKILLSSQLKYGNNKFGKTLYSLFQNAIHRASLNPFIGQPTEIENIRYLTPHPDYTIFYRHTLQKIEILVLWSNERRAGKLETIIKEA